MASPVEFYGFGARKMGRAGEGVALFDGTESILSNPASLAGLPHAELSVGFLVADMRFADFPDVWWDTNRDGRIDDTDAPLEVDPTYDQVHGALIGATRPIGKRFAVGIGMFLPKDRLIRLATFEPSLPTYFLYANRAQRYELGVGAGWRPRWGLAVGGGIQMIPRARYSLAATLDVTVEPAADGDTGAGDVIGVVLDVHSMQLDLVPGFAPNLAFHWDVGEAVPALDGLQLGASWRGEAGLPVDVEIDMQINAGTAETADVDAIVLPLVMAVQLGVFDHYVPSQWVVGAGYTIEDTLTLSADLRRTAWDQMQVSVAEVVSSEVEGAAVDLGDDPVVDGNPYTVTLRPTFAPRVGMDLRLPPLDGKRFGPVRGVVRGGVGFEPTPLVSQGEGSALLDADRFVFAVGGGVEHDDPFWRGGDAHRARWDLFFQYHLLATGELALAATDEPTAGYPVDGSAIPIGGHLLATGLQLSFEY
ncbi:MAG: OmpP1/FadL family transporter [Myxococcota bacterium]